MLVGSTFAAGVLVAVALSEEPFQVVPQRKPTAAEPTVATEPGTVETVVEGMVELLHHPSARARLDALKRLNRLWRKPETAVLPVAAALYDDNPQIRLEALQFLRDVGPRSACIAATAVAHTQDDQETGRVATVLMRDWQAEGRLWCVSIDADSAAAILRESRGEIATLRRLVRVRGSTVARLTIESAAVKALDSERYSARSVAISRIEKSEFLGSSDVLRIQSALMTARVLRELKRPPVRWETVLAGVKPQHYLCLQLLPEVYRLADEDGRRFARDLAYEGMMCTFDNSRHELDRFGLKIVDALLLEHVILPGLRSPDPHLARLGIKAATEIKFFPESVASEFLRELPVERPQPAFAERLRTFLTLKPSDPVSLEHAVELATRDPSPRIRALAIEVLGEWKEGDGASTLIEIVGNEHETADLRLLAFRLVRQIVQREKWPAGTLMKDVEGVLAQVIGLDELKAIVADEIALGKQLQKERKADILKMAREAKP